MEHKSSRSILYASILIISAFLIVVAVFMFTQKGQSSFIVLPEDQQESTEGSGSPGVAQHNFLQVTVDNVLSVVKTLHRPASYVQRIVVFYDESAEPARSVTMTYNNGNFRVDSETATGVSTVISDGKTAWVWHSTDLNPTAVSINNSVSMDDLIGIPTYESLLVSPQDSITEADYIVLPDTADQCIYVACSEDDTVTEYWIDIDSGLLLQAGVQVNGMQIYTSYQEDMQILSSEDDIFQRSFTFPNGNPVFSEE